MKALILIAAALTGAAGLSFAAPAAAQDRTVVRTRVVTAPAPADRHVVVREHTMVRHDRSDWRDRRHTRCTWQWRHHHRVRVCRTVSWR